MQELKEFLGQALEPESQEDEEKKLQLESAVKEASEDKRSPAQRIKEILDDVFTNIYAALQSEDNVSATPYNRHDMGLHVKRYGFDIKYPRNLDRVKGYVIPGVFTPTRFVDIQRAFKEVLLTVGIIEDNGGDSATIKKIYEETYYRRELSDKVRVVISKGQNPTAPDENEAAPNTEMAKKSIRLNGVIDFDLLHLSSIKAGHPNVDLMLKALFQKRDYSKQEGGVVCEARSNSFALLAYHSWHPDRKMRKGTECFKMCPGFGRTSYKVLEGYLKEIGLI